MPPADAPTATAQIAILYGSQTGSAEEIASRIHAQLKGEPRFAQLALHCKPCDAHAELVLDVKDTLVIWVTSTTGTGRGWVESAALHLFSRSRQYKGI